VRVERIQQRLQRRCRAWARSHRQYAVPINCAARTGRTPAELSVLVHEMVHHLQNQAGTTYECPAERERLAYEVQDKWLGLFGRNLEGEFEINGLALLISTSCAMAMGLY